MTTPPSRPIAVDHLQDFWLLANALALVRLLKLLRVRQNVIAEWLGVPKSNVSMWLHGQQSCPGRYTPVLRMRAQRLLREKEREWRKELDEAPTPAAQAALRGRLYAPIFDWISQVHLAAGSYDEKIRIYAAHMDAIASQPKLSAWDDDELERLALATVGMVMEKRRAREAQRAETAGAQEQDDDAQDE
jgi:hypothetical protein